MTKTKKLLIFEQRAKESGWDIDVSPATELSDEIWWRHWGTFKLKREEELRDELMSDENFA